ncbi:hypothetical protein D3C75_980350 [compost metagenome]
MAEFITQQFVCHVKVSPNNGLEANAMRSTIELHQPAKVGEIGDSNSWHPHFRGFLYQQSGFRQAINHGIVTVHPEVYETWFSHFSFRLDV